MQMQRNKDKQPLERGSSSTSGSRVPSTSTSTSRGGGVAARGGRIVPPVAVAPRWDRKQGRPMPLPEPRTPRTSRGAERRKVQKLNRQAEYLDEEIRAARGAPRAAEACREAVQFMTSRADPFLASSAEQQRPAEWNRWFTAPRRRRWSCWAC